MFSLRLLSRREFVRNLSVNIVKFKKNPGISRRKEMLNIGAEDNEESMDFEDLESDFMDVHKSHKELQHEEAVRKEKIKSFIIKQKYFKREKMPNFLTWYDKQQMRLLYNTDPEEWTIEKLSEGFPALPETVSKIVSSNWTKTKENKIRNHDNAVQENWTLFKNGQMENLPKDLVNHLKKFTDRSLIFHEAGEIENKPAIVPNKNGEFYKIISSYQALKLGNSDEEAQSNGQKALTTKSNIPSPPPTDDTYLISKGRKKMITLKDLQSEVRQKLDSGVNIDDDEKLMSNSKNYLNENKEEKSPVPTESFNEIIDIAQKKYETGTAITKYTQKELRDYSHLSYPEKIVVPKKLYKKGVTLKLNDCYYDDNGEFLYRVPGMT